MRFHDLRHTFITELAEAGVADSTVQSIAGHMSQRMIEHYSHIRQLAKRNAIDAVDRMRAEEDRHLDAVASSPAVDGKVHH